MRILQIGQAKIEKLNNTYNYDYLRDDSGAMKEFNNMLLKLEKKQIKIAFNAQKNTNFALSYLTKTGTNLLVKYGLEWRGFTDRWEILWGK